MGSARTLFREDPTERSFLIEEKENKIKDINEHYNMSKFRETVYLDLHQEELLEEISLERRTPNEVLE